MRQQTPQRLACLAVPCCQVCEAELEQQSHEAHAARCQEEVNDGNRRAKESGQRAQKEDTRQRRVSTCKAAFTSFFGNDVKLYLYMMLSFVWSLRLALEEKEIVEAEAA
eukprot:1314301-Amphidinium_carterae.1